MTKEFNLSEKIENLINYNIKRDIYAIHVEDVKEFIKKEKKGCGKFICWQVIRKGNFNTGDCGEQMPLRCGDGITCHECTDKLAGEDLK